MNPRSCRLNKKLRHQSLCWEVLGSLTPESRLVVLVDRCIKEDGDLIFICVFRICCCHHDQRWKLSQFFVILCIWKFHKETKIKNFYLASTNKHRHLNWWVPINVDTVIMSLVYYSNKHWCRQHANMSKKHSCKMSMHKREKVWWRLFCWWRSVNVKEYTAGNTSNCGGIDQWADQVCYILK